MNKTYKVRATRTGALQVVSELTSSVAAIGTKTVVAVATTMVAGAAVAATAYQDAPEGLKNTTDTVTAEQLAAADQFKFAPTGNLNVFYAGDLAQGKTLWIDGSDATQPTGLATSGTDFANYGTIYITTTSNKSYETKAMLAQGGATATNYGVIVAKSAYGMTVGSIGGTGDDVNTIVNRGEIAVETTGTGMELGGAARSEAINYGTISVGAPKTGGFGHGVLIQDSSNNTFTNYGTIEAADGASAIEVKKDATDKNTDQNTINLEAGSRVLGLVHVAAAATNTTLNLNGMQGSLLLKVEAGSQKEGDHFTLNVKDGANVTLEDGQNSTIDVADITNGTLTASIFQEDNAFKTVNLEEQGVFNITALNSRTTGTAATDPANRLLLAYGADYKLEGGRLQVAGQDYTGALKIGTNSDTKGSGELTVVSGNYTFSDVEVAPKGTLTLKGGRLSVSNTLKATGGKIDTTRGEIKFEGGTLSVQGSQIFVNKGTDTVANWGVTDVVGLMSGSGVVELTDSFEDGYSLADLKGAQSKLNAGSKYTEDTLQVAFVNGTLVLGQNEALTGDQIGGLNLADQTATAGDDGSFALKSNTDTTVAAIDFGNAEKETVTITANNSSGSSTDGAGALVLSGDNGDVFADLADTTKTVDVTGALTLGNNTEASGNVNVETLQVDNLTVVGTFTANNVKVDTTARVEAGAAFTVNSLSGGTTTVSGILDVTEVKQGAKVQAENGGTVVLTKVAGTVGQMASRFRVLSLTPEVATGFNLYGTNENARDIIANSFLTDDDVSGKEVLYLDRVMEVTGNGQVNVGGVTSGAIGAVTVGSDGIVVIDANALGSTPLITGNLNLDSATKGYLLNLNKTGNFEIASGTVTNTVTLADDNFFVSAEMGTLEGATDDKVYIKATFDKDAVGGQSDADMVALANAIESGMNADAKNGQVFKAIGDVYGDTETNVLTEAGQWAASEYVAAPVVAGTYNVAYDAAAEVTRAVMNHNVKGEGMGAWADVFYASNEAKKIYGGQGYSADVYGGVFGFDTVFSCGAKLGAALTIGQADADGERSFSKYSNDADFWGLSVYTGKNVADTSLYIGADLSYLWVDNDLKGTVAGASADESLDSTVFTVGLRADWTAYEGAFNVVPHAGVRYTAIDVDDYRGYASDSINVVELPVGVEVNGTFEASGWKVVPSVDFTIVPQVGDKDVKTAVGNVDVIDNLYNTTVGVEAVYGQYAFGLDAGYGFGTDDRQNATVKANFSYRF